MASAPAAVLEDPNAAPTTGYPSPRTRRSLPAAAALSARSPSSCPELNSTEQDVQHRCHSPNIFGNSLVVADFPGSGSFADSYREAPSQPAWGAANRTTAARSSSGMRPDPAEATKRIS